LLPLSHPERTGRGGKVRSSLLANGAWSNAIFLQAMLLGTDPVLGGDCHAPGNAVGNQYETRDGQWLLLALVQEEKLWPGLCRAIERPELLPDPRFATPGERRARAGARCSPPPPSRPGRGAARPRGSSARCSSRCSGAATSPTGARRSTSSRSPSR